MDVQAFQDKLQLGADQSLVDLLNEGRNGAIMNSAGNLQVIYIAPEPAPTKVLSKPSPAKVKYPGDGNFRPTLQPILNAASAGVRSEYDPLQE